MPCDSVPGHLKFSNTYADFRAVRVPLCSPNGVQTPSEPGSLTMVTIPFRVVTIGWY